MDRRPGLKLALLAGLVLVAHLVVLEWIGREVEVASALPKMAPPMFTRLLQPAAPPPLVAQAAPARPQPRRRSHAAHIAQPAASAPKPAQAEQTPPPEPSGAELAQAQPPQGAASQPAPAASEAAAPASEAAAEAAAAASAPASSAQVAQAAASAASQPAPPGAGAASQPSPGAGAASQAASVASAASPPASGATAAASAASAPTSAASANLDTWPTDSRLNYQLTGHWRTGPLFGDARVQWQREGAKYQVQLDIHVKVFGTQLITSQGVVTPDGLMPRAYEEMRPHHRREATFEEDKLLLEGGKTVPRPPGVQDTASQFVELSHRFATGQDRLVVGGTVTVWLARPGGVDPWTYDIVGRDRLRLPSLGEVEAYHLVPRPIPAARGNITAEMWFAPSLQYLPVRIRVSMGSEAQVDLLVDTIQQR